MNDFTLTQRLNHSLNGNSFYVKRDDLLPFSFGGNKARKAEKFFAEMQKGDYDVVVTYGSSSSNHCRIVANMAATMGLKCVIITPEEDYVETSNSQLVNLFQAEIIKTPVDRVKETIDEILQSLGCSMSPYFIQGGGHGKMGTQAYVDAYKEICAYEDKNDIKFDYIFHASGTGTTQAGLICGKLLHKHDFRKIVGISIARRNPRGGAVVLESVQEYMADGADYSSEVVFCDDYICGGYGKYDKNILNTVRNVLLKDGMALNTTYTGKAFWGMNEYILRHNITGCNILFVNTGGTPLFFDDLEEIMA